MPSPVPVPKGVTESLLQKILTVQRHGDVAPLWILGATMQPHKGFTTFIPVDLDSSYHNLICSMVSPRISFSLHEEPLANLIQLIMLFTAGTFWVRAPSCLSYKTRFKYTFHYTSSRVYFLRVGKLDVLRPPRFPVEKTKETFLLIQWRYKHLSVFRSFHKGGPATPSTAKKSGKSVNIERNRWLPQRRAL